MIVFIREWGNRVTGVHKQTNRNKLIYGKMITIKYNIDIQLLIYYLLCYYCMNLLYNLPLLQNRSLYL